VGLNHGFLALEQTQRLAKQYLISRSRDEENQQKVIETRTLMKSTFAHSGSSTDKLFVSSPVATNENKYAVLRQDRMVQLQVSTMYYEAYCGLLVSFDETEPDLLKAQVVSERIRSQYPNGEYLSPLRPVAIVTECGE
jgi:isocitrate lyase